MSQILIYTFDLVAIFVLSYVVYFRRHRRRDMLLAYVCLNVGVMAVATALATSTVGAGLGLGLFGILSIIRLRSSELPQAEVAYFFAALALGLLAGVQPDPLWLTPLLGTLLIVVIYVADHASLYARYRQQEIVLDAAYTDEQALVDRLSSLLGAEICHVVVTKVDLVRDTTVVDVRYRLSDHHAPSDPAPYVEMPVLASAGVIGHRNGVDS